LPDRAPDSPKAAPAAADQASAVPALEQVPAGRRMEARPAAPAPKKPSEVGIPEELAIPVTSSHVLYQPNDRDGGQAGTARGRAPQASAGRRRSSSPGREEMASSPGAPPRKATFSVVLVLVFATAGGFLVWSQIKSPQLTGRTESASQTPIASAQRPANQLSSSEQLRTRLVELESAWWLQLLKEQPTATLGEPVWTELSPLLTPGPNWERVNVLRLAGKLKEAREVAMQLPTTGADYALATLDLIETDHPPWELLSRRFKDAAVGETAPFLARTGFIFSLAKQGSSLAARTEYENLSKMQGASHSSLYSELGAFLRRTEQTPRPELGAEQETASAASALATAAPTPAPVAAVVTPPPVVLTAPAPAVPAEKTPQAEEVKKKKDVPEAVKAKVDQADQLWRSGDRDGAVVLYRQVVAEIGTSHFLGQRSAARVAQAAREAASGEPQ
ncbi:MAG TPA: hypothetical protein VN764_03485, partial [Polyangiaceae bacterium]|nr:hypothetical protein [Polyangiaceae bacterium]